MKKERSRMTPSNIVHKFPTFSKFQKIIDPIINTVKVEVKIGPPEPLLPPYLTEAVSKGNPYSVIKKERIRELKILEQQRKEFDYRKNVDYPITENVKRDTRIKYNANYNLKDLKYNIDMKEIMDDLEFPEDGPKHSSQIQKTKFVSNPDFLLDKRRVCLLDLAINIKEEQFAKLEDIVKEEEQFIKNENERLIKEHDAHDQYLKSICQKTSDAIRLAEKETFKKNKISDKVKRARYNMAHLNAECVKLEEEYLRLKTYKEFLRNCYKQRERKQALERTSLMNELKIDAILKEVELSRIGESKESKDSFLDDEIRKPSKNKYKIDNTNNQENGLLMGLNNANKNNNEYLNETLNVFSIEQLEKLKRMILIGFSNASNDEEFNEVFEILDSQNRNNRQLSESTDTAERALDENDLLEEDTFFDEPQDLVNVLSELEANNLSLIENVQEQEEMCDQMRSRIQTIKKDMSNQIALIDKHISKEKERISDLELSITCIKETEDFLKTFNSLERYKKIFYFGDLDVSTPEEMMDYLHEKISSLYHTVFEKVDSTKSNTIEMLKRIESLVDSLYIELQSHGRSAILKAKKIVDERKREAARLRQKQSFKEAEEMKIRKAMEKAKMPPRYRFGRRIVYRSQPPIEIINAKKVNLEELRQQEENAFFFT